MKKRSSQGLLFYPATYGGMCVEIEGGETTEENDTFLRLRDKCHRKEPKCQPDIVNNTYMSQNIMLVCLA